MKKLFYAILAFIIVFPAMAQNSDIEWFNIENEPFISACDNETITISTLGEESLNSALYTHSGKPLTDSDFVHISAYIPDKLYCGFKNRIIGQDDFGNIYEPEIYYFNERGEELPKDAVYALDAYSKEDAPQFFSKNIFIEKVFIRGKLAMVMNTEKKYALATADGEMITGFDYDLGMTTIDTIFPGAYVFYKDDEISAVADWSTGKYILNIAEVLESNGEYGIISQKENGKYVYVDYETMEPSDTEYDELYGGFFSCFMMKKDGSIYYLDINGNIYSYSDDRGFRFGDKYVTFSGEKCGLSDADGNVIIPEIYKVAFPVTDGLYVFYDDNKEYHIYNQSKCILSGKGWLDINYNLIETAEGIFDFNGNTVFEADDDIFLYNTKFDVIIEDTEKHRIGKLITDMPSITVNGSFLASDTAPEIVNGRTLVPLRALCEKTGFTVEYTEETGETVISYNNKKISFRKGETEAYARDKKIKLEAAPIIRNNRMLVPVRAMAEALGLDISWNPEKRHVELFSK